jgi:polyisoprenoid-binding protein YceI
MRRVLFIALVVVAMLAPAAARPVSVSLDPSRTEIDFAIEAVGFPTTRGVFRAFTGRITIDFDHPDRSRIALTVEAASLDTGAPALDDYIRSSAFLNTARFPEITFVSTAVEKLDERTVRVTGDLSLMGVTKPADFDVGVDRRGGTVALSASGVLQRSRYGLINGQPLVSDDVTITVATEVAAR